jgi:hypothetical protein
LAVRVDVTVREQLQPALEQVEQTLGPVSILVNNAGIAIVGGVLEQAPEDWDRVIETNLNSCFLLSKLAAASGREGRPLGKFREWGLSLSQIHGGMKIGDRDTPNTRIYSEREFKESTQVLIANLRFVFFRLFLRSLRSFAAILLCVFVALCQILFASVCRYARNLRELAPPLLAACEYLLHAFNVTLR